MERIKEISKKYILDDDFEGLMDILDKLKKSFKNESVDIMKKHLIKITKIENEYFIEFDNIEKVKIEESNILPYLEYLLQIYKDTAKNPNCIIKPVIKIKPNYNYMQIVVVDVKIKIKNAIIVYLLMNLNFNL